MVDRGGVGGPERHSRRGARASDGVSVPPGRESGQLTPQADVASPAPGYFIIAMGKLGAFELNYSSDIDLIVLYDAERAAA